MPTRIVLKEVVPTSRHASTSAVGTRRISDQHSHRLRRNYATPRPSSTSTNLFQSRRKATSSFRSSLLWSNERWDVGKRKDEDSSSQWKDTAQDGANDTDTNDQWSPSKRFRPQLTTSLSQLGHSQTNNHSTQYNSYSCDIRGSPRLLGYVFALTACAIMLASVIQFYRSQGPIPPQFESTFDSKRYFVSPTGTVLLWWKVWGAMAVAGGGCLWNLSIILAHFDSYCFPKLWMAWFRDGSLAERNLLFLLILYWIAGLHINTSCLSVGESQANVFFTSWIAFAATVNNYAVWRESAGLPSSLFARVHRRETTSNWLWTAVFSTILAGAATDLFIYRDLVKLQFDGKNLRVSEQDWTIVLSIVWSEVVVCVLAVLLNEYQVDPYPLPCRCRNRHDSNIVHRCVLGWRQLEGLIILIAMGGKYYVVLYYTGVDTVINGLSNAYVGAWGTFFSSVFSFGTWLKENRNITYVVNEDANHGSTSDGADGHTARKAVANA